MKLYVFFFFVFLQSFLYAQESEVSTSDSLTEFRKIAFAERRSYNKRRCSEDSMRAVKDSEIQNKYFINIAAPDGDKFLPGEELKTILKKHNITWGGEWMGSDIGGYSGECYYSLMTELTEKKLGKDFIDELVKKSVAMYVQKHPGKIFDYDEHSEWTYKGKHLSYTDDNDQLNVDFFTGFTYPEGYENYNSSIQKYRSSTVVMLTLDSKGKVLKNQFSHRIYSDRN